MADAFNAKTLIVVASGKNKKDVVKKLMRITAMMMEII